jgi:hypothetical protein
MSEWDPGTSFIQPGDQGKARHDFRQIGRIAGGIRLITAITRRNTSPSAMRSDQSKNAA